MNVSIDKLNINYICEGEGNPVLILHGWGANIQTVMPIVNHLKNRFKVYAVDLPGFGESDEPKDVWGTNEYKDIVKKFIDKMGLEKIILIGHSHGGRISIMLSSEYQELINKMILIDSAGLIPKRKPKYYAKVYTFKTLKVIYRGIFFWKDKKEAMEKFYKKFGSDDYRNAQGVMRNIMVKVVNENLRPYLSKIKTSTLLIWGRDDDATPLYMGEIMEKEIEDSGLVVFDNAGHFSYVDQLYSFKVVVDKFLEGCVTDV
ncbi:alpha/beta hydrolase [Clostridiaceae bacterium M8S5]|nr:alpha/beta hydrolase [Clostridiaceae bacterium M8S5]